MKKIFIIVFVILLAGCTAPHVENIVTKLPEGYTKAYHITDNIKTTSQDMENFVKEFSTKDDFVITISSMDYLILRK